LCKEERLKYFVPRYPYELHKLYQEWVNIILEIEAFNFERRTSTETKKHVHLSWTPSKASIRDDFSPRI